MRRTYNKIISYVIIIAVVICSVSITGNATSVSELELRKQQAIKDKNNLEEQAETIHRDYQDVREEYDVLKGELDALDIDIATVANELSYLSQKLSDAKTKQAETELLMKLHIKYMYENDLLGMIELLLESGSISEFFERYEYLNMIIKYDRDMVSEYKKTQEEINNESVALSAKRSELEIKSSEAEAKKQALRELVDNAKDKLSEKNAEVISAQASINEYDKKIAEMKEKERSLASTNAASKEALARQIGNFPNTEDTGGAYVGYTEDDLYLLAAIIDAEAGGEPYEGMIAVGSVVMNRVFSSKFPNTISGVVYQKNQFEPASSGRLQLILDKGPSSRCFDAAREVLSGVRNTNKLFFWAMWLAEQRGIVGTMDGVIIGTQYFF